MTGQEVVNWMNNEIMRNQIYHNHKENMAWVAIALYLTGAITATMKVHSISDIGMEVPVSWIFGIITVAAIIFIIWQFLHRRIAANKVKALIKEITRLIGLWSLSEKEWNDDLVLPTYIADKVKYNRFLYHISKPIIVVEIASGVAIATAIASFYLLLWNG